MAKIAVMGFGTVGSGVVEVISTNHESIAKKAKEPIDVKYILVRREKESTEREKFVMDYAAIENDPEIDVVVECIGGIHPAYEYVKNALLAGKSVVTSNKELVAEKGAELLQIAKDRNLNFLFEASVGGGVPIIRPMHQCLAANQISELAGILNGTTNFILTKMIRENMSFDAALKMAQDLGYAETIDPSADTEGHDACRKICILASLAFGKHVYPKDVYTKGITQVTLEDFSYAADMGRVIKLIARAKDMGDGKVALAVSPALISQDSQLASVEDVFNGILVRGDMLGDVVFYGKGAGKLPTASAVVADVIDAVKNKGHNKGIYWVDSDDSQLVPYDQVEVQYYVRLKLAPYMDGKSLVAGVYGEVEFVDRPERPADELAFITDTRVQREHLAAFEKLQEAGAQVLGSIPLLDY